MVVACRGLHQVLSRWCCVRDAFLAMYLRTLVLEIFARQKPVQDRAGHAPTSIMRVHEILPKMRRRRDRAQVAASDTTDLGRIQKKAGHAARRDWCRYTAAQTDDSRLQEQGYKLRRGRGLLGQSVDGEGGGG